MSQPDDRGTTVAEAGKLDLKKGEFWVTNPWFFNQAKKNLSAYEPNRMYVCVGPDRYVDATYVSGADSEGDGRSSTWADYDNDGRLDLFVRQVGGGTLLLYRNQMTNADRQLVVSLRGTKSNWRGIGARLTLECGEFRQVRELFPVNTYQSQSPSLVTFGVSKGRTPDTLTIRWPSGLVQSVTKLPANGHLRVTEGVDGFEIVEPK